jgi:hypothetical protein
LEAEAKEKRVRVELSRKLDTASPLWNKRQETLLRYRCAQALGHVQHHLEFVHRLVPGEQEILAAQTGFEFAGLREQLREFSFFH